MGTVTARKRKDGSVAYLARVRIMRDGFPYHETKTFDRRPTATNYGHSTKPPGRHIWWALQGKRQDFPWLQVNRKPSGHTPPDFPDLIRDHRRS